MTQFGADFLAVAHGEVHELLREAALEAGATLRTMTRVNSIDTRSAGGPVVVLDSGERVRADVVVGADGAQGVMRRMVLGHDTTGAVDERYVYKWVVPAVSGATGRCTDSATGLQASRSHWILCGVTPISATW